MTQIFAQPYDISANGFYFDTIEEYNEKSAASGVEEFELQFIDGEKIDGQLFKVLSINQTNIESFLEAVDSWDDNDKIKVIIAVGENGYQFDIQDDSPNDFYVDLYELDSMKDLAEQFVEEGLYGEIPKALQFYIDYDAIARDLNMEYGEIMIDGTNYIYRMD